MGNKRKSDNFIIPNIEREFQNEYIKKHQQQRIHSEEHLMTINLLMTSQKRLQRDMHHEEPHTCEERDDSASEETSNWHQKPYWPVLTKIKS
ncbi:Piso0_000155 [Millerozyma farinosa CBS 7064]|uniref:Piso0_000155 protein n=1 Tax=Pichia sorbitophila (strain ATCC MYA-4447 / BCRC 22081 / CBS 7064 / NBRC 10061 / NRRL Y-12695) TaxID=559304 RepID=G8YT83_PICSO|nr:Piso0_000155 [Millerozyma farinosa CBS 7064]